MLFSQRILPKGTKYNRRLVAEVDSAIPQHLKSQDVKFLIPQQLVYALQDKGRGSLVSLGLRVEIWLGIGIDLKI